MGTYSVEPFTLTFTMLAAYLGIAIMAAAVLRVAFLMCKKSDRRIENAGIY